MADSIKVDGAAQLSMTLRGAAAQLRDFSSAHQQAGSYITQRASSAAPKRSGRLAASGRATTARDSATIEFSAPYAAVIHNGWPGHNIEANPFARSAAEASIPVWVPKYSKRIVDVMKTVKGAAGHG